MQIRKLIRLLKEQQEKLGPYAEVMLDTRTYKTWHGCWEFDKVNDVEQRECHMADGDGYRREHSQERTVVVLNNY